MKVFLCVDGSEGSKKALEYATKVLSKDRDQIVLLGVYDIVLNTSAVPYTDPGKSGK